jgi:tetratricopeptide (TPR) repeat protein
MPPSSVSTTEPAHTARPHSRSTAATPIATAKRPRWTASATSPTTPASTPQAIAYYQQALALFRELGDTYETANTLDQLGYTYRALGHHDQARTVWQRALDLYRSQHRKAADRVHDRLVELTSSRRKP